MRSAALSVLVALAFSTSGCQLHPTFTTGYAPSAQTLRTEPVQGRLAVRRFAEERPARVYSTSGRIFLTYIPFLPYVTMPFERIDESIRITSVPIERHGVGMTLGARPDPAPDFEVYTYPASFARAVAEDLAAAGLFEASEYVGEGSVDGYRYVLTGSVRESPLERSATSFGLGMAGVLLWILPVPMAKTSAAVHVDLTLTDQTMSRVVWTRTLESRISRLFTLYTSSAMVYGRSGAFSFNLEPPPSDSQVDRRSLFGWHFEALRRAMLDARQDLAAALARGEPSPPAQL